MSDEQTPALVQQGELIDQISALLPTEVEGPWTSLVLYRSALATTAEHNLVVHRPDGSVDRSQGAPRQVSKLLFKLRRVMYREGGGTWLSATFTVQNRGDSVSSSVDFDYDGEPAWSEPVDPGHYALDLEDFPRDEDAIPQWLKEKVREAESRAQAR